MNLDYVMSAIGKYSFIYFFYTLFLIPIFAFLLSFIRPENLIKKYIRHPYLDYEYDKGFDFYPLRYHTTLWLVAHTAYNGFAKRRRIHTMTVREDSPKYWLILSWIYFWLIIIPTTLSFFITLFCLAYTLPLAGLFA